MLVYEDKLSGDELLSDSYPCEETFDGCFIEAQAKWTTVGGESFDIGANPSAEGGEDEGADDSVQKVVDLINAFQYVEQGEYSKKDLMSYFKVRCERPPKARERTRGSRREPRR